MLTSNLGGGYKDILPTFLVLEYFQNRILGKKEKLQFDILSIKIIC